MSKVTRARLWKSRYEDNHYRDLSLSFLILLPLLFNYCCHRPHHKFVTVFNNKLLFLHVIFSLSFSLNIMPKIELEIT